MRQGAAGLALVLLTGCGGPVGWYHRIEGGEIAKNYTPPPGSDAPYPNLGSVPANLPAFAGPQLASVKQQLAAAHAQAAAVQPSLAPPAPPPPPALKPADTTPIALGFAARSAILTRQDAKALGALASAANAANAAGNRLLAVGFGGGSLPLAILRARAVSDALTAAGVSAPRVRSLAIADGAGGFAQIAPN